MGTRREPRALTDSRAATDTVVLALLGFPAMIVPPDLGCLLAPARAARLTSSTRTRRSRLETLTIASTIIGACTTPIYVMDTASSQDSEADDEASDTSQPATVGRIVRPRADVDRAPGEPRPV
jgi:hypothetical protein